MRLVAPTLPVCGNGSEERRWDAPRRVVTSSRLLPDQISTGFLLRADPMPGLPEGVLPPGPIPPSPD